MAKVVGGTESEDNMNMSMSLQDLLGSHSHGGRRVKRKSVVEEPLVVDKVTLQKQRRMIKNRESAARSRERKQVCFYLILYFPFFKIQTTFFHFAGIHS